jgi:hypothetical protein
LPTFAFLYKNPNVCACLHLRFQISDLRSQYLFVLIYQANDEVPTKIARRRFRGILRPRLFVPGDVRKHPPDMEGVSYRSGF